MKALNVWQISYMLLKIKKQTKKLDEVEVQGDAHSYFSSSIISANGNYYLCCII